MNKKWLLLFFAFFFLPITAFSSQIDEALNSSIYNFERLSCIGEYLNESFYDDYVTNNSFKETTDMIMQEIIDSNYTIDKKYSVFFLRDDPLPNVDVDIEFLSEDNGFILGTYTPSTRKVRVYMKSIKNFADSQGWGNDLLKSKAHNTLLHELSHYLDHEEGFVNSTYTFNINSTGDTLHNTQYYIDLYNQTGGVKPVPLELRRSLNFTFVFDIYDEDDYEDEVIARINAVCLQEPLNMQFGYPQLSYPDYCDNFNWNQTDADTFQAIAEEVNKRFVYDEIEGGKITFSTFELTDNAEYCSDLTNVNQFIKDSNSLMSMIISEFTDLFLENIALIPLAIAITAVITFILLQINRLFDLNLFK